MPFALAVQALLLASGDPVGAVSSVATSDAGPLAGCAASRGAGDGAWKYECRGVLASVIDDARSLEPGSYLDGRVADLRHAYGEQLAFARDRARVAGRDAIVLRATGARGVSVSVALLAAAEGTRVISCMGEPRRCARVTEALVSAPWARPAPGARVRGAGELRLGESGPVVPPGCRAMPAAIDARIGMIACTGDHHVAWAGASDDVTYRGVRDALVKRILSSKQWPGDPEEVPCRIAGMSASCSRLRAPSAGGREVAMWGTATVGDTRWFASCVAAGDEPVPSPCSSVFSLR